ESLFDTRAVSHLGERAVAVIVEEQAGRRLEHSRNAIKLAAEFVVATGEMAVLSVIHKAANEKVQPAVVVEVEPDRARRPVPLEHLRAQPRLLADIGECAVP